MASEAAGRMNDFDVDADELPPYLGERYRDALADIARSADAEDVASDTTTTAESQAWRIVPKSGT